MVVVGLNGSKMTDYDYYHYYCSPQGQIKSKHSIAF